MALSNTVGRSVITTHAAFASRGFDADFIPTYNKVVSKLWTSWSPLFEKLSAKKQVKTVKPEGSHIVFGTELTMSSAATASGEGDTLPTVEGMTTVQGKVDYQRGFKARFSITEEAFTWGRNGSGVFEDVVEQETRGVNGAIEQLEGCAAYGDGSGQLAYCASLATTASMTVTSSETYSACTPGTRWLYEGMRLAAINVASNTPTSDASFIATTTTNKISAITSDTAVTLGTANQLAAASYLTTPLSYTSGTASSSRWPCGLNNIIDDGTFSDNATNVVDPAFGCCGLPVATYPQWKAVKSHNSGTARALTLDLFYQLYFKLTRKAGKMNLDMTALMNTDVYRELVALIEPQVVYQPRELNAGFKEMDIMINGTTVPIMLDHKCPSYIYFVSWKDLDFYNSRPIGIVAPEGQKVIVGSSAMTREYRIWHAWNMGTKKRNAHGIIADISKTITSV